MKRETPPRVARWMLERWTAGADGEALAGDLLEEFRAGRGAGWYWRQAAVAMAMGFLRELRERRMVGVFALLWAGPLPWLWLHGMRHLAHASWMGQIWALPWPWSTIWAMGVVAGPGIVAVWTGMAVYLLLHFVIERPQRRLRIVRGLAVSAATWVALGAGMMVAPVQGGINTNTATIVMLLRDPVFLLILARQVVAPIVGIWAALPREERRRVVA